MNPAAIEGARNLLLNCAGVRAAERLLILHEDPALGWYDDAAPRLVAAMADELGVRVELRQCGGPDNRLLDTPTDGASEPNMDDGYDCCIFFARIGDQLRFDARARARRVMCYAGSLDALASSYGSVDHHAMADLKSAIDDLVWRAGEITISCPLGSDLRGRIEQDRGGYAQDVTVMRFPVGVHVPIDAAAFSGRVRLARYLTPTGSRTYHPPWVAIDEPVTATVENGRIVGYDGGEGDVGRIERQYARVASEFGIAPDVIHSWHAGIHPGCRFDGLAADDPDRWSNTVFTSPRFVHFHTCGDVAPGEICWMVLDPTIRLDGVPLWDDGVLQPDRFPATRRCLDRWPVLRALLDAGNGAVGLPDLTQVLS